MNFRYCEPGEVESTNECVSCRPGTYSLTWNSTRCLACMTNASCLGGKEIHVEKGYWRRSMNSTSMIECIREDSCLGGYKPNNTHPVEWDTGYEGVLCTDWVIKNGEKYERMTNYECSKCPNPVMNALRVTGLLILVGSFFIILIIVGIKKKKESQQSILLRISANYLQLLTATLAYNLQFPDVLTKIFLPVEKVGSSSEAFMSLDWFFRDAELNGFAPSSAIFKIFLTGLLPILLTLLAIIVWGVLYWFFKKWFNNIKRNIIVTVVVILFLLHPMLTKVGLEIFQCVQVDEEQYKVRVDFNIDWYSGEHLLWCGFLGAPIILIWSIGSPLIVFIVLFRNRHSLQEPHVQKYFLLLYQGLKDKVFYWELVNTVRKSLIVAINAFMSTLPLIYAAVTAVIVLIALVRLQLRLNPYKLDLNNKIEVEAMLAGTATLYWGVLFISDTEQQDVLIILVLFVICFINIRFILFWCLWMVSTLVHRHEFFRSFYNLLAIASCRRKVALKILEMSENIQSSRITTQNDKASKRDENLADRKHNFRLKVKHARKGKCSPITCLSATE